MNEQRFVVSDVMWQRLEPHLPGRVSDAGAMAKDNLLFFWKQFSGGYALDRRGATYRLPLAIGTVSSGGFAGGPVPAYSSLFKAMSRSFDALLADKAFDADWLLQDLDERGATAVIAPKASRKIQRHYDTEV